eukprot:1158016-Pelagomonas_calceolata.AAC.9
MALNTHLLVFPFAAQNAESEAMQRRWIAGQTELVGLQNENGGLTQTLGRMRSEHTVLVQKRRRLELSLESHQKEIKALGQAAGRLHVELQRVNGLIAQNAGARETLAEANTHLEMQISGDLRDMETEAARMQSQIDDSRGTKRDTLAEIVEVERQGMACVWDGYYALGAEADAGEGDARCHGPQRGPGRGGRDEARDSSHAAEARRAHEAAGEAGDVLTTLPPRVMLRAQDLEKALTKRELVAVKGRATAARVKAATSTRCGLETSQSEGMAQCRWCRCLRGGKKDSGLLHEVVMQPTRVV